MSYDLILTNSTGSVIDASDGQQVRPGDVWKSEKALGNAYFHSDEVGSLSFRDIGDQHISGDSKETWGVLIGGKMNLRRVLLDPLVPLLT